jgi:hypothetical protein
VLVFTDGQTVGGFGCWYSPMARHSRIERIHAANADCEMGQCKTAKRCDGMLEQSRASVSVLAIFMADLCHLS